MKTFLLIFFAILFPLFINAQLDSIPESKRNSIVVTPLGDLINDNRPSIYFKRILGYKKEQLVSLRIGTEFFNSLSLDFSSDEKEKITAVNFKIGFEFSKVIDRLSIYYGPEFSLFTIRVDNHTLDPTAGILFSTNSIVANRQNLIDNTTLSVFSLIGFLGFKYELTKSLTVGYESAFGFGRYNINESSDFSAITETSNGFVSDLAINRFIWLGYSF